MEVVGDLFVDTSAWIALAVPEDAHHGDAVRLRARLAQQGVRFHTSDWALAETVGVLERRRGREIAHRAGDLILQSAAVRLAVVTEDQVHKAWQRFKEFPGPSLVDCASFTVMEDLGITRAFAFDDDFSRAGFHVIT